MTATLKANGVLVLPRKLLKQHRLRAGDKFEINADPDEPGVFELRLMPRKGKRSLVDVLLACPVKGWMQRMPRRIEPRRRVR